MRGIEYYISNLERYPLSGEEVSRIANGVPVVPYHELVNYESIQSLLGVQKAVCILFETTYDVGHYCALYFTDLGLHFFDPYGMKPDQELKYATYNQTPYLSLLLQKYEGPLFVNRYRYQTWSRGVNTCGRHAGVRLRTRHVFSDEEYRALLGKPANNNADWYVSALTLLFTLSKS